MRTVKSINRDVDIILFYYFNRISLQMYGFNLLVLAFTCGILHFRKWKFVISKYAIYALTFALLDWFEWSEIILSEKEMMARAIICALYGFHAMVFGVMSTTWVHGWCGLKTCNQYVVVSISVHGSKSIAKFYCRDFHTAFTSDTYTHTYIY